MSMIKITSILVFAAAGLVLMFIGKLWLDRQTKFNDDREISDKSNLAVALRRAGFYIALTLALAGALYEVDSGIVASLKLFAVDGIAAIIVLILIGCVNDRVIFKGINRNAEVGNGNAAVGLIEAGAYLAAGLVLYGSFTGEGGGVVSAAVFAVLGQAFLLIFFFIQKARMPFDLAGEIRDNNKAAGLAVCGELAALGIVLSASIAGPFTSWTQDLTSFGISALTGIILLLVLRTVSDWLFLPYTTIGIEIKRDRNIAAAALIEGISVAVAIIVSSIL